jgi:hypothetical protein
MIISKFGKIAVAASFAAVLAMPTVMAQEAEEEDTGPNYILVRTVNTTNSGTDEWVTLQEQFSARAVENGTGHRDVWEVVRGRLGTFHIVSLHVDRAGFDEQGGGGGADEAQADWRAAIQKTVASRAQTESRLHKNLSIPLDEDAEPSLLTLRRFTLKPGQIGAFHDWVEEELKPALEAGGAKGVYFSHVTQGGDVATCVVASHFANWAELDGPGSLSHMSEGERDGLFADFDDMVETHTVNILSYRTELSY